MSQRAIDILYDDNYENYKTQIMTPIEEFQRLMNNRLDAEVEVRKANTKAGHSDTDYPCFGCAGGHRVDDLADQPPLYPSVKTLYKRDSGDRISVG